MITNRPGRQNIRKIGKRGVGLYKPYGNGNRSGVNLPPLDLTGVIAPGDIDGLGQWGYQLNPAIGDMGPKSFAGRAIQLWSAATAGLDIIRLVNGEQWPNVIGVTVDYPLLGNVIYTWNGGTSQYEAADAGLGAIFEAEAGQLVGFFMVDLEITPPGDGIITPEENPNNPDQDGFNDRAGTPYGDLDPKVYGGATWDVCVGNTKEGAASIQMVGNVSMPDIWQFDMIFTVGTAPTFVCTWNGVDRYSSPGNGMHDYFEVQTGVPLTFSFANVLPFP